MQTGEMILLKEIEMMQAHAETLALIQSITVQEGEEFIFPGFL